MSNARLLAALSLALGLAPACASALTPLSIESETELEAGNRPSVHARAAPSAFERRPDAEYEPTAYIADRNAGLQCVPFAREEAGVDIRGDASTWWRQARVLFATSAAPSEDAVLVLKGYNDERRGHVAVVKEVVSERLIIVDHANWLNREEVTRDVPVRDVSELGDWSLVQVWHVEGKHWGGRSYRVQGFISGLVEAAAARS